MRTTTPRLFSARIVALTSALVFAALVYAPGLNGPFVFDDYHNIARNKALSAAVEDPGSLWEAMIVGTAGPLKRPLSTLSFAANLATTGKDVRWFKATNIAIHLLNGLLLFLLVRSLVSLRNRTHGESLDAWAVAMTTAAIWLVHPAQLTSVLYVVQRMTSLSATFLLGGLWLYCRARARAAEGHSAVSALWVGVPILAMASALAKENGVLLFVYAFVLEISLLNFRPALAAQRLRLPLWHTVFVGLPALAALVWVMLNVDFSGAPAVSRPYNAIERLLTQSRVLWMYLELLLMPRLSELALFYDDLVISRSIFEPLSTLLAVSATAATLLLAVVARRRAPWLAFAVFWFLAGHLIESTVILLELAHVHRNYVPYAGPILAIVVGINGLLGRSRMQLRRFLAVALVAGFGLVTAQRAYQWSDPVALALYEVHHRPESARANYEAGRLYFVAARAQKDPAFRAMAQQYLQRASELDRYSIGAPVALLILGGGPDYVEGDPALATLLQRLRQRPLAQAEVQYLRSLVECQSRVDCRRPAEEMLKIFAAMMESPGTAPGPKADMLAVIGLYYARVLGDLPACLRVMEEAVRVAPDNPIYTLNLAQAYMVARRLDAAAAMLTDAERSDRLGAYASRIAALRSDLSALARGEG